MYYAATLHGNSTGEGLRLMMTPNKDVLAGNFRPRPPVAFPCQ